MCFSVCKKYRRYVSSLFRDIEEEEDKEQVVYTALTYLLPILELLVLFKKNRCFPLPSHLEYTVGEKIVKLA